MAQKECEKCGELTSEAKAFCPGCGHAFVDEERRREKSKFESMDNTVQLGQTMFGNMLSDMGLNISKAPNAPEKKVEVIAPVAATAAAPKKEEPKPSAQPVPPVPKTESEPAEKTARNHNRLVAIVGILAIVLWVLVLIAGFVMFVYMPRSGTF